MTNLLSDNQAVGKTQEILNEIKTAFGMVPNFFKAQADVDPDWLELNWKREQKIMLADGALDRKTKELIAFCVSLVNRCNYCSLAHETLALMSGASEREILEAKQVVELFASFNSIADSLGIPCDVTPDMVKPNPSAR
jgi:AhpD family alkylhydroperoxidase